MMIPIFDNKSRSLVFASELTNDILENRLKMKSLIMISCLIPILVPPSYCIHEHVDLLQSCLIEHNVNNFSTFQENPTNYFELLASSVQNLRFTGASIQKPVGIIVPDSKEELINSVLCCRAGSWEIRFRSGGHSYEGSSYTVNDGSAFVLIDMMNLNRVSIDVESGTAWVEGGATLGETYYSISESSRVLEFPAGIKLSPKPFVKTKYGQFTVFLSSLVKLIYQS